MGGTLEIISKHLILWAFLIATFQFTLTSTQMSAKTKDEINGGINTLGKVLDVMDKKGAEKSLIKAIGGLAPYLGAVGGFISFILIFLPQQDSAELRFMKKSFAEVNTKLDKITMKLDHIENLLKYEVQRAAYLESAKKITYGFQKMHEFFDELERTSCTDEKNCARIRGNILTRYIEHFDIQFHMYKILTGAVSKGPFNEPLLNVLTKSYQCDVGILDTFSNGLLKLSFKAQMVVLTHEKVTGTKISIIDSMKSWLKSVYDLREYTNRLKNACYGDIKSYMLTNIKDSKYQTDYADNDGANNAMRSFMREKYAWLDWNVYSYQAYGGDNHYMLNVYGGFWNSPSSKEKRKRNIAVALVDKSGTYRDQGYWVWNALDEISRTSVCGIGCGRNLKMLLDMIEVGLKKKNMFKYVTSINIIRDTSNTAVLAENPLTYINQIVKFKQRIETQEGTETIPLTVRLLITLKSLEKSSYSQTETCSNHGERVVLPYSSKAECQCKRNFDGQDCKYHSKNGLATTIDALISTTIHLPTLVDIYHDLNDLRDFVNIGFGHIERAINRLRSTLIKAYEDFGKAMSQRFQWVNLQIIYSQSIQQINYYSYRFSNLYNSTDTEKDIKLLAQAVLAPEGVRKWLYNLNELFMGNSISPIGAHKPLMMMYMDMNAARACSQQYKVDVDNVFRQFAIIQQKGYIIWAQALEIFEKDSEAVDLAYKDQLQKQNEKLTEMTCQYTIPDSINIQCSGGRYIHPKMVLATQCRTNYYIAGERKSTCTNKVSQCKPCSCYPEGSHAPECEDITGKCKCKSGFYGDKCQNRDCVWNSWSGYSSCSKSCDYGGTHYRRRSYKITKVGQGKSCSGTSSESESCFNNRCCSNQFHCTRQRKCISSSYRCDYDDHCGDKQDEEDCRESCSTHYTAWNDAGGGKVYYLDRHNVDCGGSQNVLQMFHLQRSGGKIRYQYRCCRLNRDIASYHQVSTGWNKDGPSSVYLDRHYVICAADSYLNGFRLQDSGDNMRYNYYCDKLNHPNHKQRQTCFTGVTPLTYVNDAGHNYYLDRQIVDCGGRYFINSFHLRRPNRDSRYWQYEVRCCRVRA